MRLNVDPLRDGFREPLDTHTVVLVAAAHRCYNKETESATRDKTHGAQTHSVGHRWRESLSCES